MSKLTARLITIFLLVVPWLVPGAQAYSNLRPDVFIRLEGFMLLGSSGGPVRLAELRGGGGDELALEQMDLGPELVRIVRAHGPRILVAVTGWGKNARTLRVGSVKVLDLLENGAVEAARDARLEHDILTVQMTHGPKYSADDFKLLSRFERPDAQLFWIEDCRPFYGFQQAVGIDHSFRIDLRERFPSDPPRRIRILMENNQILEFFWDGP